MGVMTVNTTIRTRLVHENKPVLLGLSALLLFNSVRCITLGIRSRITRGRCGRLRKHRKDNKPPLPFLLMLCLVSRLCSLILFLNKDLWLPLEIQVATQPPPYGTSDYQILMIKSNQPITVDLNLQTRSR